MEKWGIVDDETGTNLSVLYDLLREQFQDPDDPWCKETLKWWDEYVLHSLVWLSTYSQTAPQTSFPRHSR